MADFSYAQIRLQLVAIADANPNLSDKGGQGAFWPLFADRRAAPSKGFDGAGPWRATVRPL